ncbi:MAG: type IV pilin protein [Steroidobacteraceae bacterium]|jgi:type IV pilus assembly protein PilE
MTQHRAARRRVPAGFSLIELMIVVTIVAILAAIAIPQYNTSVRKSRRTEAKTALLDLAGREERYFNTNNAYSSTPSDLGYGPVGATFPESVGSGYYQVTVAVTAAAPPVLPTYTITAVPITVDQLKDTSCLFFSVTNTGLQSATTMPSCWQ